jgi:hypothetical protein
MTDQTADQQFERLSRYVDGELPDGERAALEARLRESADLRSQLAAIRRLNDSLSMALAQHGDVPQSLRDRLGRGPAPVASDRDAATATILPFPEGQKPVRKAAARPWRQYAAAACVLAAVGAVLLNSTPGTNTGLPGNDRLVARALDTLPSGDDWSDLGDGRELRPLLTFAHRDGTWCREYLLRQESRDVRAVACRDSGRWETQAAGFETYLDSTTAYRPAGASDSAPVSVFISENAAGIALGRSEEQALLTSGWR